MILLSALVLVSLVFATYLYGCYKHDRIAQQLVGELGDVHTFFIPMLGCGKKVRAFTIEKTSFVISSATVVISWPSACISRVKGFLGLDTRTDLFVQYARTLAEISAMKSAAGADYIVAVRCNVIARNARTFTVCLHGAAIYKYPDTLPVFIINPRLLMPKPPQANFHMISAALVVNTLWIISLAATYYGLGQLNRHYAHNFSTHEELVMWSYIEDEVHRLSADKIDLLKMQQELGNLLNTVVQHSELQFKKTPTLHIAEEPEAEAYIYPDGHILLTSGLIAQLESFNQVAFIVAHLLWHYHEGEHLKQLTSNAISLKFLANVLGENSFIGKMLVWRSDFAVQYPEHSEIAADHFALLMLEKLYGSVYGYDVLQNQYLRESDWSEAHPESKKRTLALAETVSKANNSATAMVSFNSIYHAASQEAQPVVENSAQSAILSFDELVRSYDAAFYSLHQEYLQHMYPFSKILLFDEHTDAQNLSHRIKIILAGLKDIAGYDRKFKLLETEYRQKILTVSQSLEPIKKQAMLASWQTKSKNATTFINLTFKQDRKLLEAQQLLIKFLYNRSASITFTSHNIIFQTHKEREDYVALRNRVDKIAIARPTLQ
jgi:hypothetical protein